MPLTHPSDSPSMDMLDRLRALLESELPPGGYYTGPIKGFPPSSVSEEDEVVVSVHQMAEDPGPATMSTQRAQPYVVLTITVYEAREAADHAAILRRLANLTEVFRQACWKYRAGPPASPRNWHGMQFTAAPGHPLPTLYEREPQQWQRSITVLTLKTHRSNP